jgi:hypothetical protein
MRRAKKVMMWACCTVPAVAAMVMTGAGAASAATTLVPGGPPGIPQHFPFPGPQNPGPHNPGPHGPGPSCSKWQLEEWNLNGANTVTLIYNSGSYSYSVALIQKGSCLTGTLTDTHASPNLSLPITGTVNGNHVSFSVTYPATAGNQGIRTFTGTIGHHGAVSGTWAETGTEHGSGPWSLTTNAKPACPPWYRSYRGPRECAVH